jgi:hypothetical protein
MAEKQRNGLMGRLAFLALAIPAAAAVAQFWPLQPERGWWTALWVSQIETSVAGQFYCALR